MIIRAVYGRLLHSVILSFILSACQDQTDSAQTPKVEIKPATNTEITALVLPPLDSKPYVKDQYKLPTGVILQLWQEQGVCQLQIGQQAKQALALKAPCRFIRSPASDTVQVFKADLVTRLIALIGDTKDQSQCGAKVRGIIVRGKTVTLAPKVIDQGVVCAQQGLNNADYMQFLKP